MVLIYIVVFSMISVFIHECGHAIVALLFGSKNIVIEIGKGKKLFKIGFIQVNSIFFFGGLCWGGMKGVSKIAWILFFIGGPLGTVLTMAMIYLIPRFMNLDLDPSLIFALTFVFYYNASMLATAILPIKYEYTSDGYHIMKRLREGSENH